MVLSNTSAARVISSASPRGNLDMEMGRGLKVPIFSKILQLIN